MTTTTKKPAAHVIVRSDDRGVSITLPKASSVSMTRCRDVCLQLAATAPTVSARARGIAQALNSLITDLNSGPKPLATLDDTEGEEASE